MSQENEAADLRVKALESAYSEPEKGLKALWQIVRRYPDTWTAKNLVADDILDVARVNQLWDEVILACTQAKEFKPDYAKSYSLEAEAALLMKQGRQIDALETYLKKETLYGTWSGTLCNFGIKFAELGAHDRAWALFNQAVACAAKEGASAHLVRQSMARLLIKEGRTGPAVEMLLVGYWEACKQRKKGAPKSMVTDLKRTLKLAGIRQGNLAEELISICRDRGWQEAVQQFNKQLEGLQTKSL